MRFRSAVKLPAAPDPAEEMAAGLALATERDAAAVGKIATHNAAATEVGKDHDEVVPDPNALVFKLASVLLQYPDSRETEGLREGVKLTVGELPAGRPRELLERFVDHWNEVGDSQLEHEYVADLDFNREASMFLSFHAYGDRRERGMAMVKLKRRYAKAGLLLMQGELPDYLPVMLEFAAHSDGTDAQAVLADFRPAIELVREVLEKNESAYADVIAAVCACLPKLDKQQLAAIERIKEAGPPDELVGLEPYGLMPPDATGGCSQETQYE